MSHIPNASHALTFFLPIFCPLFCLLLLLCTISSSHCVVPYISLTVSQLNSVILILEQQQNKCPFVRRSRVFEDRYVR
ncbi:hypothetical protein B0H34DRAFT_493311 [Crassisporium funariophilum]|nr:hypothetical protein B0H34DRAFT_493311 [Crassisporium funariophilum]